MAKTMSATMMALRSRAVARRTFIVAIAKVLGDLSGDDLDKPSVDILFLSLHDAPKPIINTISPPQRRRWP